MDSESRCKVITCPNCGCQVHILLPADWEGDHRIADAGACDRVVICKGCGSYIPVQTVIPWEGGN